MFINIICGVQLQLFQDSHHYLLRILNNSFKLNLFVKCHFFLPFMFFILFIQEHLSHLLSASNGSIETDYFYCKNDGYVPTRIRMWSYGDGICDCCDGSDEIENKHAKCENTCHILENERVKISNELKSNYLKGLEKMEKLKEEGEKSRNDFKKEKAEIESKIEETQKMINKLEKLKEIEDKKQKLNDENKKNKQENTIDTNNSNANISDPPAATEINENIEEQDLNDETDDNENSEIDNEYAYVDQKGEVPNNKPNEEVDNVDQKEEVPNNYHNKEINNDDQKEEIDNKLSEVNLIVKIWKYTFFISDEDLVITYGFKMTEKYDEKLHSELKSKLDKLEDQKRKLEDQKHLINSDIAPQYIPLYGKEFSDGDFKLKIFKDFKQDYTSIGRYEKTVNNTIFMESGSYCWQTQSSRKSEIKLVCWSDNKLINTVEASQCEYKSIFATPAACTKEDINNLNNKTVPELLEIKEELGLE